MDNHHYKSLAASWGVPLKLASGFGDAFGFGDDDRTPFASPVFSRISSG